MCVRWQNGKNEGVLLTNLYVFFFLKIAQKPILPGMRIKNKVVTAFNNSKLQIEKYFQESLWILTEQKIWCEPQRGV